MPPVRFNMWVIDMDHVITLHVDYKRIRMVLYCNQHTYTCQVQTSWFDVKRTTLQYILIKRVLIYVYLFILILVNYMN